MLSQPYTYGVELITLHFSVALMIFRRSDWLGNKEVNLQVLAKSI